jgi:hypothetical protein
MRTWTVDRRRADVVGALLFLLLAAFAYWRTTTWEPPILPGDPGAAFFPRLSISLIAIFSLVVIMRRLFFSAAESRTPSDTVSDGAGKTVSQLYRVDIASLATGIVSSGLLVAAMTLAGFEIPALIFLFALLAWRSGNWVWSAIGSVITVAVVYVVFVVLLKVHLPLAFLPKYLGNF